MMISAKSSRKGLNTMSKKVVIIGLGHLGAHVSQMLALRGIADEIVGIDYK